MHGAEFFAYHGFYSEEQKLGSRFVVDIEVGFEPPGQINETDLGNTVDYELIYEIACNEMKHTRKLIETVAQAIIDEIKKKYAFVDTIQVSIKKLNPLLGGVVGYSTVIINHNGI